LALTAALIAQRTGVPNGFVLGPLFATIALTGSGVLWSAVPQWLINAGQLMLGCSLGSRFEQDFFHSAPRFLFAAGVATLAALGLSSAFAVTMGWLAGIHWTTAILALAPGGMPEMSITAKVLQLGVPVVVAFHVTRMAILVTVSGPVFRRFLKARD
jgi:membrane AbrB-like protein